jgi:hypothetical protein
MTPFTLWLKFAQRGFETLLTGKQSLKPDQQ